MGCTVFVVRHGQTDANKSRQVQGQTDTPLNATGEAQARALGAYLQARGQGFSAAVTSPLVRAARTAELILSSIDAPPALDVDARLMERHFGAFEGQSFAQLADETRTDRGALYDQMPPGGESLETVQARALEAFAEFTRGAEGDVLLVAHGGVIGALSCQFLGLPYRSASLKRFRRDNTGVTRIAAGVSPVILSLNATDHL